MHLFGKNRVRVAIRPATIVAAAWILAGAAAKAQPLQIRTLMGEVQSAGSQFWGTTIQLETLMGGPEIQKTYVRPDGRFEFENVRPGTYQVSILDGHGAMIWSDTANVLTGSGPLVIRPETKPRETAGKGTVSLQALRRKPSSAAAREMRLAEKASARHSILEVITHLESAAALSPDVADLHNDLGAAYLQAGAWEPARQALETAVRLDPDASIPHANLALSLLALGRIPDAVAEGRLALRRDPLSPAANYAAGAALERQPGSGLEALRLLERAEESIPQALLLETRVLLAHSRKEEAAGKLRQYLKRPNVEQRDLAARWLARLIGEGAKTR